MARTRGLNPIETIEEANLNPGGDETTTHIENEDKVIHNINQIVLSPVELSVTEKLTNLIKGYYKSFTGEYPLTEFYFYVSEDEIEIYDRWGAYLLSAGIGSFTVDEINWILDNLPKYIKSPEVQDMGNVHLDFTELRNEGWMVWRRSGTLNNLIGFIRRKLSHIQELNEPLYYFDDRSDNCIVSNAELNIINEFIQNTVPVIDVSNIVVDYTSLNLLIGEFQQITVTVYPLNATNPELNYIIDDPSVVSIENNVITALDEGFASITIESVANPDVSTTISIEVLEFDKIQATRYEIIRENTDPYEYNEAYITGFEEGFSITSLLATFRNRIENLHVFDQFNVEVPPENFYYLVTTGMTIKLIANGEELDQIRTVLAGDIDGNGSINEYDKQCIRDYVNGYSTLEGCYYIAADVDDNLVVDLNDLNKIDDYIRGEIESLN